MLLISYFFSPLKYLLTSHSAYERIRQQEIYEIHFIALDGVCERCPSHVASAYSARLLSFSHHLDRLDRLAMPRS